MKKQSTPQAANIFKFRFTPLMIALACAVLVLCILCIALSVWRIVDEGINSFNDALKSPFLILICLFGIAIIVGVLIRARYLVTEEYFITQFGFIKSKFPIKSITSLLLDTDTQKLTVYMGEEFFVILTDPRWNNDLVQAIRRVKPDVEFSFTLADAPKKDNEK